MDPTGSLNLHPTNNKRVRYRIKSREKALQNSLLLNSGYLADETVDVKFVCKSGKVVRAHKVALCLASKYFTTILHDQNTCDISSIFIPDISAEVLIAILTMVYKREEFLIPQGLEDQVIEWLKEFQLAEEIVLTEAVGSEVNSVPFHPPARVEPSPPPPPVQNAADQLDQDFARPFKKRKTNVVKPVNEIAPRVLKPQQTTNFDNTNASFDFDHFSQASYYGNPPPLEPQSSQAYYGEPPELDSMMGNYGEPMPGTSQQAFFKLAVARFNRKVQNRSDTVAGAHSAVFKIPLALNNGGRSDTPMPVARGGFPEMGPPAPPKRGRGRPRGSSVAPKKAPPSAAVGSAEQASRAQSVFLQPRARSVSRSRSTSRARSRTRDRSNARFAVDDKAQDYRGQNMAILIGENPRSARLKAKLAIFKRENNGRDDE